MRVKIAYSVELEEVESEVQEVLSRGLNNLEDALKNATEACMSLNKEESSLQEIIEKLTKVRVDMFKADSVVSDCCEILMGYAAVLEKAKEEVENEEI